MDQIYLNPDSAVMIEFLDGKIGVTFDSQHEADSLMNTLEGMGYEWAYNRMPRGCTPRHVVYMKAGNLRWSGNTVAIHHLHLKKMSCKKFCLRAEEPADVDSINQDALISLLNS